MKAFALFSFGWLAVSSLLASPPSGQGPGDSLRLNNGWELQDAAQVQQSGEALSQPEFHPNSWHRAVVPGTVLTSLVLDGIYPEPLYGENNRTNVIPDSLCRTTYWYRNTFTPPQSYRGKQVWLAFDGINYIAEVWVNGHQAGTIKGAFTRGIFDITPYVTPGAPNGLAVHVLPQPHPGVSHEKTIATGTGRNGGVTGLDGPTFLCSIGWDWIPTIRDRDTGIWQDVRLFATGPVVVEDPYVTTKLPLPRTDSAELTVQATVRNVTDTPQNGTLTGAIDKIHFKQTVSLAPREARTVTFSPAITRALHVKNPRLWWPNGYGPQNLYTLRLAFAIKGAVSDSKQVNFGVRQISHSLPGSDNLALSVNGVPVIAKGGDWGMDEAMKRIPRERLDAQVRMHQLANYTIIRNWVGQSTSADLYDLCDQYGILLWDEFFEPHPADGPIPPDVELYLANVKDKILRFRTHPSIALWCARNEGDPPPAIGDGIRTLIHELDPGRLYQPSSTSGRGVNSGGPYHWRTPREFYTYNEAFKTEIGSISVPTLEAIHGMMPSKDWEVINDDWAEHDFCSGAQQGDRYPIMISQRYGQPWSLADFVRKAQLANYECFRAMYEGRFAKLFAPETGVITWMSSPAQPSFVWQLYSHDLEPNSSLYATRKACEPIHIQMNQNDWRILIINNTPRPLEGLRVKNAIYNLDGTRKYLQNETLTATPSAASQAGQVPFLAGLSDVHFVKLELRDAEDHLLSENFYWRARPEEPDNFRALNTMPIAGIEVEAGQRQSRGKCLLDVTVRNPSHAVALLTHLQLRKARSSQRVLPVFYTDNYISLLPGEVRYVSIEAPLAALEGDEPLLAVDGWNVALRPVPYSGRSVRVTPNTEAQVHPLAPESAAAGASEWLNINCGGGQVGFFRFGTTPQHEFVVDSDYQGGDGEGTGDLIDTEAPHCAPPAVYRTERHGSCTYRVPALRGHSYTVRLHFAEVKLAPGEREFNVEVNGRRAFSDLDIAAEAGRDKALVKDVASVSPDADGNIVIAFTRGSAGEPLICGIQILE
ncbi:MAG TPA: malectin domain-containing carbohydrate-binding protein [Verrucomicrobiae bacterium]|nr:malectin domain-containing carbohydrate-binding protein [Verrucomicrobiae bacterium]